MRRETGSPRPLETKPADNDIDGYDGPDFEYADEDDDHDHDNDDEPGVYGLHDDDNFHNCDDHGDDFDNHPDDDYYINVLRPLRRRRRQIRP